MRKPARILMVSNKYPPDVIGGAEIIAAKMSESLAAAGHHVAVITTGPRHSPTPRETVNGVNIVRFWPGSTFIPPRRIPRWRSLFLQGHAHLHDLRNLRTAGILREMLDEFRPDVVHSHNLYGLSPIVWRVAKDRGVPVVHTAHDSYLMCPKGTLMRSSNTICRKPAFPCRLYQRWYMRQTENIDMFCAPTEEFIEMHQRLGLRAKQCRAVTLTLNFAASTEPMTQHDNGCLSLMYMGQLEPHKGLRMLLKAFSSLPADAPVKLNIAGLGAMEKLVRQSAEQDRRIVYHGFADGSNKQELIRNCDAMVVPSVCYDSGPLTILEAFNAAIPVIASTSCGYRELVTACNAGLTFTSGDTDVLAAIFGRLLEDRRQLRQMSRNAFEAAKAHSFEKMLSLYSEIYGSLLRM